MTSTYDTDTGGELLPSTTNISTVKNSNYNCKDHCDKINAPDPGSYSRVKDLISNKLSEKKREKG